jgi:hypothetical protein
MLFFAVNYVAVWEISAPTHTSVPLSRQFRPEKKSAKNIHVRRTGGLLLGCTGCTQVWFPASAVHPHLLVALSMFNFIIFLVVNFTAAFAVPYTFKAYRYSTRLKD